MLLLLLFLLFPSAGSLFYPEEKLCFFSVTLFASTWEACTSTTNPVESINRESVPKDGRQKSLVEVLSHLYRIDKVYVAKKVAATSNVSTLYRDQTESIQEKRRERKRKWRRRSDVKKKTILKVISCQFNEIANSYRIIKRCFYCDKT